jgi:enoyl-CoA hydratase/carnithine racemase
VTLARLVGPGPARRLLLDPGLIDGAEAHRVGLVHLLVDQAVDVDGAALRAAASLAGKPPDAITATRSWLAEVEDAMLGDIDSGADAGLAASIGLVGGAEERELLRVPARGRGSP